MDVAKKNLIFLVIGIWMIGIVEGLIGVAVSQNTLAFLLGILVGCAAATFSSFHIYHTLDMAMDLDERHATVHAKKGSMIRLIISFTLLLAACYWKQFVSPVALLIGLLNLKFSVYLVPIMEKITSVNQRRKE